MNATDILMMFAQVVIIIMLTPLFNGLGRMMRAKFQSRSGPSDLFQTYRDIIKLFKRSETLPESTSWVFRTAPYLMFAVSATLLAAIPVAYSSPKLGMFSDFLVFVYLVALMRFIFGIASLDSGSPFAAIGGSREQVLSILVEPTLVLSALVVVLLAESTSLVEITSKVQSGAINYFMPAFSIGAVAFLWATYVETGKNPFDLAEAEQELQEGLLAEYGGRRLALAKGALAIRQCAIIGIFCTLFLPWPSLHNPMLSLAAFVGKLFVFYIAASFVENFHARYHILKMRLASGGAFVVAVLSLILYVVWRTN